MIKIYNQSLVAQCIIPKLISIQWTKRFYDAGSFEMHFSKNTKGIEYLQQGYFVTHGDNCGIIMYQYENMDDIEIRGYDLSGLLKFRNCNGDKSGKAETVIKSYITDNVISPVDTNRKINLLQNATNQNRGDTVSWVADYSNLLDEISSIASTYELGFDIVFDRTNKKFIFDVSKGTDRTTAQSAVSPVLFCKDFKNLSEYEYENDHLNDINTVYVHNDSGVETVIANITYTGLDRKETYEDCSDDDTADQVQTAGQEILSDNLPIQSIEADTNSRLRYKIDWFLGDYVTVKIKALGETLILHKQITEVEEIYENNNTKITPTFGTKKASIIEKLMKG